MLCRNIARLASAVTTSMRTERCPRENAHRWRRLSTAIPNSYFGREVFVSSCNSSRRATPKGGESSVLRSQLNISLHRNHRLVRVSCPTLRRRSSLLPRVHRYIEIAYSLCKSNRRQIIHRICCYIGMDRTSRHPSRCSCSSRGGMARSRPVRYVFSHTISSRRSPSKSRKMVSIKYKQTGGRLPSTKGETAAACSKIRT